MWLCLGNMYGLCCTSQIRFGLFLFLTSTKNAIAVLQPGFKIRVGQGNVSLWYDRQFSRGIVCQSVNDIHINDDNNWICCWSNMVTDSPLWLKLEVESIFINAETHDVVAWGYALNDIYTISFAYGWLTKARSSTVVNDRRGSWVWPLQTP